MNLRSLKLRQALALLLCFHLSFSTQAQVQWLEGTAYTGDNLPIPVGMNDNELITYDLKTDSDPRKDKWLGYNKVFLNRYDLNTASLTSRTELKVPLDWELRLANFSAIKKLGDHLIAFSSHSSDLGTVVKAHRINEKGEFEPGGKTIISCRQEVSVKSVLSPNHKMMVNYYFLLDDDRNIKFHYTVTDGSLFSSKKQVVQLQSEVKLNTTYYFGTEEVYESFYNRVFVDNRGRVHLLGNKEGSLLLESFSLTGDSLFCGQVVPEEDFMSYDFLIAFDKQDNPVIAGTYVNYNKYLWERETYFGYYSTLCDRINDEFERRVLGVYYTRFDLVKGEKTPTWFHRFTREEINQFLPDSKMEVNNENAEKCNLSEKFWDKNLNSINLRKIYFNDDKVVLFGEQWIKQTYSSRAKGLVMFGFKPEEVKAGQDSVNASKGEFVCRFWGKNHLVPSSGIPYYSTFISRSGNTVTMLYNGHPDELSKAPNSAYFKTMDPRKASIIKIEVDLKTYKASQEVAREFADEKKLVPLYFFKRKNKLAVLSAEAGKTKVGFKKLEE